MPIQASIQTAASRVYVASALAKTLLESETDGIEFFARAEHAAEADELGAKSDSTGMSG